MSTLSSNWNYPNCIRAGAGRISELAAACRDLKVARPLLVTDRELAELPMIKSALELCKNAGLKIGLFSGIHSNPNGEQVDEGVEIYRQGKHDGVIAFGGGSALDAGKAIALMSGQQRPLWDFEDVGDNWTRVIESGVAPVVAVPTTAGTGSEVGRASVIIDTAHHVKKIIFHPKMLPSVVILDPGLTTGLPPHITAATGLDALAHNLEALCARGYHPMADGIAMEGIRLVHQFLPRAVEMGDDLEARMQMLSASSMGATAFQKGLGGMHALAHPLGALYNAHHGLLNAVLMPYVLKANRQAIDERMQRLGRYLGLSEASFDGVFAWILELRRQLNIPHTLTEIGIDAGRAEEVSAMAIVDPSAGGNPIAFSTAQYMSIFQDAVNGSL